MEVVIENDNSYPLSMTPESLLEEISQNCRVILATPKGSVPGDRRFGTDTRSLDKPSKIARTLLIADIIDALDTYEPRAIVKDIKFHGDELAGRLLPVIVLEIKEEYE